MSTKMKYTCWGTYTMTITKEQTIEASSEEEAEEKFVRILDDTGIKNRRKDYHGWEYEIFPNGGDQNQTRTNK